MLQNVKFGIIGGLGLHLEDEPFSLGPLSSMGGEIKLNFFSLLLNLVNFWNCFWEVVGFANARQYPEHTWECKHLPSRAVLVENCQNQSRKTFQQWEKLIICSINAFLEAAEFNLVFVYDRFQYQAGSLTWRESFDWQQYQNRKSSSLTKQAVSYFGTICKRMVQSLFW